MDGEFSMEAKKQKVKKKVAGVGINDADYAISDGTRITCPFYKAWHNMINRCYNEKAYPSYRGCIVYQEWHFFMAFRAWMKKQDWKGKELDKDLLGRQKKLYSPETCYFIPSSVNSLISGVLHTRFFKGSPVKYLLGVAPVSDGWSYRLNKTIYVKGLSSEIEAHKAYCIRKSDLILESINLYKYDQTLCKHLEDFAKDLRTFMFTSQDEFDAAKERHVKWEKEQLDLKNKNDIKKEEKEQELLIKKRKQLNRYSFEVEFNGVMYWFPSKKDHHQATKKVYKKYTVMGITDTFPGLCRHFEMDTGTVDKRIKKQKMSLEDALTKPLHHIGSNNNPPKYWTKDLCQEQALKYVRKGDWREGHRSSYEASKYHGWFEECSSHMLPH